MVVVRRGPGSLLTPGICVRLLPLFSRICTLPQPAADSWGSEAIRR